MSGRCRDDGDVDSMFLGQATEIFNACMKESPKNVPWYYPCLQMTKYNEKTYLLDKHPELFKYIHYCRRPVKVNDEWRDCNKCKTCKQILNSHWQYIWS